MTQELDTVVAETGWLPPYAQATIKFYQWEIRGRGWFVWGYPVTLEPPFEPFPGHLIANPLPNIDNARTISRFGSWLERTRARLRGEPPPPRPPSPGRVKALPPAAVVESQASAAEASEPGRDLDLSGLVPELSYETSELVEMQVTLPASFRLSREAAERLLLALSYTALPVSFELVGLPDQILCQFACRVPDVPALRQQLQAYFPEGVLREDRGFLARHWDMERDRTPSVVVEFGLSDEFMRPLQVGRGELDPLIPLAGALSELGPGEVALYQVIFQAARAPWAPSILRAVTGYDGKPFFADAPEMGQLARMKVQRPLFAAVVRVAAQSPQLDRAWEVVRNLGGGLVQFRDPLSNELIPITNEGYEDWLHVEDVANRNCHRCGMLLNSDELVSLAHLPSISVRAKKLRREERTTRAAPAIATGHRFTLGTNEHAGRTVEVSLQPDQRTRHTHVIGASGTGKSTLLLQMILQDLRAGQGFAVLDPHGDLVDQILGYLPEQRARDVVLFDPSDEEYPVGFNILSAHSTLEKTLLASDLVAVFRRLSTSWGDQMTSVLGNAILAFLESTRGGTLADLRRFLVEKEFRKEFLATVQDSEVVYYWEKEFPLLTGKPQAPLLTRLDTFLRPRLVRHMVAQQENRLDFARIMDDGKIFLAKLAQGAIGEENAYLLGTLLVSKFHQLTLSRQEQTRTERRPFYLYLDEFQHFITPSMATILSGARKYGLGLVLAHQDLRQLGDTEVTSAVLTNPYTRICFRVGEQDARRLVDGFSSFTAKDLQNLGTGEAICRVERAEYDFNLRVPPLPAVEADLADAHRERAVASSRGAYGTPRAEVEALLQQAATVARPAPKPPPGPESPPPTPATPPTSAAQPGAVIPTDVPARSPTPEHPPRAKLPPVIAVAVPDLPVELPPRPTQPGKGGSSHQYYQALIKKLGEASGFRVLIEYAVLGTTGSVDVALLRGEQLVLACEISVSSTAEQELQNVLKCLAAGFEQVAVVSTNARALKKVEKLIEQLVAKIDRPRVLCLTPEQLVSLIEELGREPVETETTVRGYKVKTRHKQLGEKEQAAREKAVHRVIAQSVKRRQEDE